VGPRASDDGGVRTIWLTGLSGAGKSTLARALGWAVIDGDDLRRGLCSDLGFSPADRAENVRRAAHVARILNDAGVDVVVALISPLRAHRALAREIVGAGFREAFVKAPLAVCEARDPKGLYARARRGELADFTGVSAPYEEPEAPDLTLDTSTLTVEECVQRLIALR
jgi:adenylyl-sulfate kinase